MTTVGTLRVDGATIHHQVEGDGPLLLLMPGAAADADGLFALAEHLVDHFTLLTYDRRGYTRSPIDQPDDGGVIPIEVQVDDVHRVLAAHTDGPALVFGSSLGAVIALELTAQHPEQVRMLVAHEPPLHQLLAPEEAPPQFDLSDPNAADAIKKFAAALGVTREDMVGEPVPGRPVRKPENARHFLMREAPSVGAYHLDFDRLRGAAGRIVVAGGVAGREYFPYLCASRAAAALDMALVEFPGHHGGMVSEAEAFAAQLRELFATEKERV